MWLIRKVLYRLDHLYSSVRHWTVRRFTAAGLAVLGALAVSAAFGIEMEQSVAYQVFTLLAGFLLLALLGSLVFRARFSARRALPRFGTAGQPLLYRVSVRNESDRLQTGLTLLEELADPRPTFAEFAAWQRAEKKQLRSFAMSDKSSGVGFKIAAAPEVALPPLPPGQETEVSVELLPLRRGLVRLRGLSVARADPLGLLRSLYPVPLAQSVVILPKRYALPDVALPGATQYQQGGVALASAIGQSEEFVSLRDYRPGDPLRHIHWRSWARAGRPVVKEFADEFFVRHALVLDTFTDHPHSELFEEAVAVAASFACTVRTQESLLDLLFVGAQAYCFTAGRGLAHTEQMLEVLAAVRVCPDRPFSTLEPLVFEHAGRVSGCICVLLGWDAARQQFVRRLRQMAVPLRVLVLVEKGAAAAVTAGVMAEEPGAFHVLELGAVAQGLARL
jgi:uncharacterized protein (DUF58 family)